MPILSLGGVSSGIDTSRIIAALISVERRPVRVLEEKRTAQQSLLTAFSDLTSRLSALRSTVEGMDEASELAAKKTSSTNEAAFSATAIGSAAAGNYSITVTKLAQATTMTTGGVASGSTVVGTSAGNFDFTVGGVVKSVAVTTATTLDNLRDGINGLNAGVTATIINDGSSGGTPNRLILTSNSTGVANAISGISAPGAAGNPTSLTFSESQAAQDANFTVNTIALTRSSNTVSDAISGVTLTLKKGTSAAPESGTVTVTDDTDAVKTKIKGFITAYNAVASTIFAGTRRDDVSKAVGPFLGDSFARTVSDRLEGIIYSKIATTVGSTITAAGNLTDGDLKVNGVNVTGVTGATDVSGQAGLLRDRINAISGSTNVTAGVNAAGTGVDLFDLSGSGITLTVGGTATLANTGFSGGTRTLGKDALSQIGIKTQADGTMVLDDTVLSAALTSNSQAVVDLFIKKVDTAGVTTSIGVAEQIKLEVANLTSSIDGATTVRQNTIKETIAELTQRIADQTALLAIKEDRLRIRFGKLDELLSSVNQQGAFLSSRFQVR